MTIVLSLLLLLAVVFPAYANPACAVCTIAVGASLEIARSLGVDDSVVGGLGRCVSCIDWLLDHQVV